MASIAEAFGFDGYDPRDDVGKIERDQYDNPMSGNTRGKLQETLDASRNRRGAAAAAARQTQTEEVKRTTIAANERANFVSAGPAAQAERTAVDRTEDQQARAGQTRLTGLLTDAAEGRGPSAAMDTLRRGTDRAIQQQMAVGAAQGGNPAMARRAAAQGAAATIRGANADAAILRTQEINDARAALGQNLSATRGLDAQIAGTQAGLDAERARFNAAALNSRSSEDAATRNAMSQFNAGQTNATNLAQAGFSQQSAMADAAARNQMYASNADRDQQTRLANLEAEMRQRGYNDEQIRFAIAGQQAQDEADRQARIAREQDEARQEIAIAQTRAQTENAEASRAGGFWGSLMNTAAGAATSLLAASDPAAKTAVQPMGSAADQEYVKREQARYDNLKAAEAKADAEADAKNPGKIAEKSVGSLGKELQEELKKERPINLEPNPFGVNSPRQSFASYMAQFAQGGR